MTAGRLLFYLLLNVLVSAAVSFGVFWFWRPGCAPLASPTQNPGVVATPIALTPVANVTADNGQTTQLADTPDPGPQPSPTPTTHVVQAGETLGAIAVQYGVSVEALMQANDLTNPDSLSEGQLLVIPVELPPTAAPVPTDTPPAPTPAPLPTSTRDPNAPAPALIIREVLGIGSLEQEVVVIVNNGGPADLAGWSLRDESGHQYNFPALTLFAGGAVNVHTLSGSDTVIDLYWGQPQALWSTRKVVLLFDPSGVPQARYVIP